MRSEFIDDKYLYAKCEPVIAGEEVGYIIETMRLALFAGRGVGLAANQVGFNKRIIMIHTQDFKATIINPVVEPQKGGTITSKEGCLSFPGKTAIVVRSRVVRLSGALPDGKPLGFKLAGMSAIIAQHECDHLEGLTCMDKATKVYS